MHIDLIRGDRRRNTQEEEEPENEDKREMTK